MSGLLILGLLTALAYFYGHKHKMIWPITTIGGIWLIVLLFSLNSNFFLALIALYATYKMLGLSWDKFRHDDEWRWAPPPGPLYDPS